MPSICIQLYVLGLLVLMGSRAEEYYVGGSMSTNLTSTDTPSAANQTPSAAANQTPSAAANQTPSAAANQTPSAAANQTPSAAAQTTSSGLTSLSQSQGWESTVTTETITFSPGSDIAGYVILFLILLAVVCLAVILCILRKKSKRYSFDLQHPGYDHDTPLTCMEQPGTFEPNNDQEIWDSVKKGGDEDPRAMSSVANGSAMGAGETWSTGENEGEKQGHGDGDSFFNFCASDVTPTPPIKRVDFSLDLDLSDSELLGSGPDL